MKLSHSHSRRFAFFAGSLFAVAAVRYAQAVDAVPPRVVVTDDQKGQATIAVGEQPLAVYRYRDDEIPRPYFAHLRTLAGVQVSRRHPPDPKLDLADHPAFHPGLWLAFGDVSGADYWRNAARVELEPDSLVVGHDGPVGLITARYRYLAADDAERVICREEFRARIAARPQGWLLDWESAFTADPPCQFGDQEEMGLGVRVATEMRAEHQAKGDIAAGNGRILDAAGRRNGATVWGKASAWCDFSGQVEKHPVGVALLCDPENFRPSWFHARDYGLIVANPFGRRAFGAGDTSSVTVSNDHPLRLRWGVFVHDELKNEAPDLAAAFDDYLHFLGEEHPAPATEGTPVPP